MPSREVKVQNVDGAMEAASRLYIKHGIDRVTKEMIAKESGLSRKTIDRYFSDKTECVLRVMEWMMYHISMETNEAFPESYFNGDYTGAELLEKYMMYIKKLFLKEPKLLVLYTEFKMYIYRNCDDFDQQYSTLVNTLGNHRLRCKIYEKGIQDGSFPPNLKVGTEEEYLCESFFGFLSNLAMSMTCHSAEEIELQIDHRIKNTVLLYQREGTTYRPTENKSSQERLDQQKQ